MPPQGMSSVVWYTTTTLQWTNCMTPCVGRNVDMPIGMSPVSDLPKQFQCQNALQNRHKIVHAKMLPQPIGGHVNSQFIVPNHLQPHPWEPKQLRLPTKCATNLHSSPCWPQTFPAPLTVCCSYLWLIESKLQLQCQCVWHKIVSNSFLFCRYRASAHTPQWQAKHNQGTKYH